MLPAVLLLATAIPLLAQKAGHAPSGAVAGDAEFKVSPRARALHRRAIVVDTHDDTTQRLIHEKDFDLSRRNTTGHVDIPRMREGGLDAVFFSIYISSSITGPEAVKRSLRLIDSVYEAVRRYPNDLVLATTAADIRRAASHRKIAALMGMEGGHMIDDDLGLLRSYARLGVRYLTLTHSANTSWADSSGDTPRHDGLTAFGKDVVRELNRLGVMVDVSHVADKTFYDALEVTRAPVIASHSSCRAIANHPRNMTDDMLRALARNGGVVMINYSVGFLSEEHRVASQKAGGTAKVFDELSKKCGNEACAILELDRVTRSAMMSGELPKVTWEKIVERSCANSRKARGGPRNRRCAGLHDVMAPPTARQTIEMPRSTR